MFAGRLDWIDKTMTVLLHEKVSKHTLEITNIDQTWDQRFNPHCPCKGDTANPNCQLGQNNPTTCLLTFYLPLDLGVPRKGSGLDMKEVGIPFSTVPSNAHRKERARKKRAGFNGRALLKALGSTGLYEFNPGMQLTNLDVRFAK